MTCTGHRLENCKYTDVVVIGNGPSGICLSYLLSGNMPYYNGTHHSNPLLLNKLKQIPPNSSIVNQDLEYLAEGLEGRSSNPVALLFDALSHPDADLGSELPSLMSWKLRKKQHISHAVLGKFGPGGAWQNMDGKMQTLSQSNWMELPSVPFKEWQASRKRTEGIFHNRATIEEVRGYYEDFVKEKQLTSNFYNQHIVTSVQKVFQMRNGVDSESGEVEPCCKNVVQNHPFLWEVRGYKTNEQEIEDDNSNVQREEFCFAAPHVVLATGTYDIPNKLGAHGENLPYVLHSLSEFEKVFCNDNLCNSSCPILVIGAGLTAADTILMALEYNIPVIHVFRSGPNDSSLILKKLPSGMYPEYHRVHLLMKGKLTNPLYKPYPKHNVVEFKEDQKVLLENLDGNIMTSLDISYALVLIGSRPDLFFLPQDGQNLGGMKKCAIESKHNPIDINPYSHQCNRELGLYAMGPLIGDNFVRFAVGGALAITNHMIKKQEKDKL